MMEFTKSATDNLYKFIALSGIALIGLGIVLQSNLLRDRTDADIEASVSAEQMTYRSERLLKFIEDRVKVRTAKIELIDASGEKENWEQAKKAIEEHLEVMEKDIAETNEIMLNWIDSSKDARIKTEKIDAIEQSFSSQVLLNFLTIGIGAALTVTGFSLWYFKLQRHLDVKVAGEATVLKLQNKSAMDKPDPVES